MSDGSLNVNIPLVTLTMDCLETTDSDPAGSIKQECVADELDGTGSAPNNMAQPTQIDSSDSFDNITDLVSMIKSEVIDGQNEKLKTELVEEGEEQPEFDLESTVDLNYPTNDETDTKLDVEDLEIQNEELDFNEVGEEDPLLKMQPRVILLRLTEDTMARVIELHRTSQQDTPEDSAPGTSDGAAHNSQDLSMSLRTARSGNRRTIQPFRGGRQNALTRNHRLVTTGMEGGSTYYCSFGQYNTQNQSFMKVNSRGNLEEKLSNCGVIPTMSGNIQVLRRFDVDLKIYKGINHNNNTLPMDSEMNRFKCTKCPYQCGRPQELGAHMCTPAKDKPFECSLCARPFRQKAHLKSHMTITHSEERSFKCTQCAKSFKQKMHLKTHMLSHSGAKPYHCALCSFKCGYKHGIRTHLKMHSDVKEFKCSVCSKSFRYAYSLKTHVLTHTGEKPFKCNICSKTYRQSNHLRFHKMTHAGHKPYECDLCPYRCTYKQGLGAHMRVHTGEKPFVCKYCGKTFAQSSNLNTHMVTHTGLKPFKCDICGYRCSLAQMLKMHMRVHTDERPYGCKVCAKRFRQSPHLTKHMRSHRA